MGRNTGIMENRETCLPMDTMHNSKKQKTPTQQDREMDLLGVLEEKLPAIRRRLKRGAVKVAPLSFDELLALGELRA